MTIDAKRRTLLTALVAAVITVLVAPVAVWAQAESRCDERFPDQEWVGVVDEGGVAVHSAALDSGIAARFADDALEVAALLRSDLGSIPDMTVCVYGADTTLDGSELQDMGLLPEGQRLHAVMFADEALLFVDAQQTRLVGDAISLGLANIALWHVAATAGETGYPEPLASAIGQWYASRLNGKSGTHRATMRVAAFYNDPRGDAEASDWLVARQQPISVWNPEYQESPIGDLVADAVAARGTGILRDPDPEEWAAADLAWRAALRRELLQGAEESRDWIGGALIAGGSIVAAILLALWGRHRSRRRQVPIGDIAQVEGFFDR